MPTFIPASVTDRDLLAPLVRDFYAEEHLHFTAATLPALETLLSTPTAGAAFLIRDDHNALAGYFILTFSFSLERAGKIALLDELYILPAARRKGLAKAALHFAVAHAKQSLCTTLVLEVAHDNPAAHALYTSLSFSTLPRHFLTLPL